MQTSLPEEFAPGPVVLFAKGTVELYNSKSFTEIQNNKIRADGRLGGRETRHSRTDSNQETVEFLGQNL